MRFGTTSSLAFNLAHPRSASQPDSPQITMLRKFSRCNNGLSFLCLHSAINHVTLDTSPFLYRIVLPPSIQRMNPPPHVFIKMLLLPRSARHNAPSGLAATLLCTITTNLLARMLASLTMQISAINFRLSQIR